MSECNPIEEFFEEAAARGSKWNEQLSYWCDLYPSFTYPPKLQQVPGLEASHVLMRQSGRFSSERLYLQFRRERLVFEICGAPFGTGFFVSSRLFDRRKRATWFDIILLFLLIGVCGAPLAYQFGWLWGIIGATGLLALLWSIMRLAATETITWLDRTLSDLPLIGLVYDRFFHPDTYYRQDTNNAYGKAVNHAVRQAVDEMRSQKGLKALRDDEWRPVTRDRQRR